MKKILILGLVFLAVLTVVFAAQDDEKQARGLDDNNQTKNMTFGTCVSEAAVIKNTCYADVKETRNTCKEAAKNQTDVRAITKTCDQTYKQEKTRCKQDFKAAKKECGKIKHNFFDEVGVAFK